MDLQRFFFLFFYEIYWMREKVTSLWRVECKVFGSKFECVWMENEDDNNGVQVGLKNEGLER